MKYDKTATIVLALCISMGIHTKADARWNWYDRVLQPIVSNQMSPAWDAMINTAQKRIVETYQQYIQKIASQVNIASVQDILRSSGINSSGGIGKSVQKGDTVIDSKEDLNVALNELFLENMKKNSTTIESVQPGMFDFTTKVLDANKKDREDAEDRKETMISLNKGTYDDGKGTYVENNGAESYDSSETGSDIKTVTYRQIINPDGSLKKADKIERNSVVISYTTNVDGTNAGKEGKQRSVGDISISTPSGQALLRNDIYNETLSALRNYQFKVFNEKMEENKETLERINTLMTKINQLEKAGLPNSSDIAQVSNTSAAIASLIADEALNIETTNAANAAVEAKYKELDKKCKDEMDVNAGFIADHANELDVLISEQEWLDDYIDSNSWRWNDDYYDDIVPTSVLQARLDSIKNTGAGTQAIQNEITWLENLINQSENSNHYGSYYWDDDYGVYTHYRGYYDEDGYFHYYGVRYSDLQQRLRTVETNIKSEEAEVKKYCDKFEQAFADYQKNLEEFNKDASAVHNASTVALQRLKDLSLQLAQARGNIGTTAQQEKERKVMVESLLAELATETAKLESGSNRLDQAIEIYKKEEHTVEQKKAIASTSFQGADPYNLTESEIASGMQTPEELDKGYVTRKGKRK